MQEVTGSIPVTSTNPRTLQQKSPSSRGLGHRPFTAVTGVRIPVGTPVQSMPHSVQGAHTMSSPHLAAGLAMAALMLAVPALSQTINTVAGGGAGDGSAATIANLSGPQG